MKPISPRNPHSGAATVTYYHYQRQKSETTGFSSTSVLCADNLQVVQFITLISTSALVEIHTFEDYHFTSSDDAIKDILYLHD